MEIALKDLTMSLDYQVLLIIFYCDQIFDILNQAFFNKDRQMNRRGLSIDSINKKYRGSAFVGTPVGGQTFVTTTATPVSTIASPIIRKSVVRTASPITVQQPISTVIAPATTMTQPLIQNSTTVVDQGSLVPINRKVETIREVKVPTYQSTTEQATGERVGVNQYSGFRGQSAQIPKSRCHCPWWLWLLLLLPLLGLVGLAIGKFLKRSSTASSIKNTATQNQSEQNNSNIVVDSGKCSPGFFFYNGNCMRCPAGSGWNSTHCVTKQVVTTKTSKTMELDPVPSETYGSTLKSGSLSSFSNVIEGIATSSEAGASTSGSITGSKTIGEEMKRLGLDYESFRKKLDEQGGLDLLLNSQPGNVVAPVFQKAGTQHHLHRTISQ